jgi:hypothetical protein
MIPNFSAESFRNNRTRIPGSIPIDPQLLSVKMLFRSGGGQVTLPRLFANDIYKALSGIKELFAKYQKLHLAVKPFGPYPLCILEGTSRFGTGIKKELFVRPDLCRETPEPGSAYIVSTENELAYIIKHCRKAGLKPGEDIGILSFTDSPLKELLDITVITSDVMWKVVPAALPVGHKEFRQGENAVRIIQRSSL